jgi:hypothetical protein
VPGGYRVTIDGEPWTLARKPSEHGLSVMRGHSNTKKLREMETVRFAETTYTPCEDGVYLLSQQRVADQAQFVFWFDGKKSKLFTNKYEAEISLGVARKLAE